NFRVLMETTYRRRINREPFALPGLYAKLGSECTVHGKHKFFQSVVKGKNNNKGGAADQYTHDADRRNNVYCVGRLFGQQVAFGKVQRDIHELSPYKWVGLFFVSNRRFRPMAGIHHRLVRQRIKLLAYTGKQLLVVASGEIGAADAVPEEDIATDEKTIRSAVKTQVRGGVSRSKDQRQFIVAEAHGTRCGQECFAYRRKFVADAHLRGVVLDLHQQGKFSLMKMGEESILFINVPVSQYVIDMAVRVEKQLRGKSFVRDKGGYGIFFRWSVHSGINDRCGTFVVI